MLSPWIIFLWIALLCAGIKCWGRGYGNRVLFTILFFYQAASLSLYAMDSDGIYIIPLTLCAAALIAPITIKTRILWPLIVPALLMLSTVFDTALYLKALPHFQHGVMTNALWLLILIVISIHPLRWNARYKSYRYV